MRKKTPLQYACSLGLFTIVARLLKEGANPNLVDPKLVRPADIDFDELPLDIVLNPKLHQLDLQVEGLEFVRKYDSK